MLGIQAPELLELGRVGAVRGFFAVVNSCSVSIAVVSIAVVVVVEEPFPKPFAEPFREGLDFETLSGWVSERVIGRVP